MHSYESLGILLKENDKLKNATVLFLREKHNSVSSFCQDALKMILNYWTRLIKSSQYSDEN